MVMKKSQNASNSYPWGRSYLYGLLFKDLKQVAKMHKVSFKGIYRHELIERLIAKIPSGSIDDSTILNK